MSSNPADHKEPSALDQPKEILDELGEDSDEYDDIEVSHTYCHFERCSRLIFLYPG
jgi:hypothetical protein